MPLSILTPSNSAVAIFSKLKSRRLHQGQGLPLDVRSLTAMGRSFWLNRRRRSKAQLFGQSGQQQPDECCSGFGAQPQEEEMSMLVVGEEWASRVRMMREEASEGWRRRRGRRPRQGERMAAWWWHCYSLRGRTTWSGSHQQRLNMRLIISQLMWEKNDTYFFRQTT